jgi:hypothetical protein
MRFLTLLFIALFVTSCGNQKLRFVRTDRVKQQVVELEEISTLKKKRTESIVLEQPEISNPSEVSESTIGQVSDQSGEEIVMNPATNNLELSDFPTVEEDSVKLTPEEIASIEETALRSEKHGKWSFMFSLLNFLFIVLGIVMLVLLFNVAFYGASANVIIYSALSILMGLSFLSSFAASIVFGIKSLRARYTTPLGKKRAITGLVLSGALIFTWLVLFLLGI